MRPLVSGAVAAALLLIVPGAAVAQAGLHDGLAADIVRAVNTCPRLTVFDDVQFSVEDGLVTLTGKVTLPYKREEIGARVAQISGVRAVVNRIDVLPASADDDALRRRIARAIYGHPSFWSYAAMANPPIHIIVERGHVTLTGVVASDLERMLARSLASGWGEVSIRNELETAVADGRLASSVRTP